MVSLSIFVRRGYFGDSINSTGRQQFGGDAHPAAN